MATALEAARAWLGVARNALEASAECAKHIELAHLAQYEAERTEVQEAIADAEYWLKVGEIVRRGLREGER